MLGVIIGATAALGTCALLHCRRHRGRCGRGRHRYYDHGCGYGHDYGHDYGRRRGPARWVAMVADRIDASPAQEQVMHDAVGELLDELRTLKQDAKATRSDLAGAFTEDRLDEDRLGELFARHDELLGGARKAFVGALSKIHDVLEPRQREQLARWLGRRGGFGPYRM